VDDKTFLTVGEVAEILGLSKYQVYRRIARGNLKAQRAHDNNVHYVVAREDVDAYVAAGGIALTQVSPDTTGSMLRVSDVATMTGYSPDAIRKLCKSGRLPHVKGDGPRGHVRIPRDAVEEMLKPSFW
jgi:excisionase family DNA binding protein